MIICITNRPKTRWAFYVGVTCWIASMYIVADRYLDADSMIDDVTGTRYVMSCYKDQFNPRGVFYKL